MQIKEQIIPMVLGEVGQQNPMRIQVCKKTGDNEYTIVTPPFRCKDFLNEVVVSYNTGKDFSIFGFKTLNKEMGLREDMEHLPLFLTHVSKYWYDNCVSVLNPYLKDVGFPSLDVDTGGMVFIPLKYLESTFYISIISLLLRCMSQTIKLKGMEHCLEYLKVTNPSDYTYMRTAVQSKPLNAFLMGLKIQCL